MKKLPTSRELMELLRHPRRRSSVRVCELGDDATDDRAPAGDEDIPGCDDPDATLDLAALQEGHLSPEGIQRLARHLEQCITCRIVVATIVAEAAPARGTRVHTAVQGPDEPEPG